MDPLYGQKALAELCEYVVASLFEVAPSSRQQRSQAASAMLREGIDTPPYTPPLDGPASSSSRRDPPVLIEFIAYALYRTRLPVSIVHQSLLLLSRLKQRYPSARGTSSSPHRLFLSALMLSAKISMDDTYSNKSWAIVGSNYFALKEVNQMERELFAFLGWNVVVNKEELDAFVSAAEAAHAQAQQQGAGQHRLGASLARAAGHSPVHMSSPLATPPMSCPTSPMQQQQSQQQQPEASTSTSTYSSRRASPSLSDSTASSSSSSSSSRSSSIESTSKRQRRSPSSTSSGQASASASEASSSSSCSEAAAAASRHQQAKNAARALLRPHTYRHTSPVSSRGSSRASSAASSAIGSPACFSSGSMVPFPASAHAAHVAHRMHPYALRSASATVAATHQQQQHQQNSQTSSTNSSAFPSVTHSPTSPASAPLSAGPQTPISEVEGLHVSAAGHGGGGAGGGKAPVVHSAGLDFPEAAGYFVR